MAELPVLVQRTFIVDVPPATAWRTLADIGRWPDWAPHIRAVEVTPPGPLGPTSRGRFRFAPGGSGAFAMQTWDPPTQWAWAGHALGVPLRYLHAFEPVEGGRTRLRWRVHVDGRRVGVRAGLFALAYARLIDRAWPRFRALVATQRT
jgi:hypothetical protein